MKRRWYVVLSAFGVAVLLLVLSLFRGAERSNSEGAPAAANAFIDDSLGVAIQFPTSKGWSLRREAGAISGKVASIVHATGRATVVLYVLPASPQESLEDVLKRRQARFAALFGARDLSQLISRVVSDTLSEVNGRSFRHWQALTQVIEVPGEEPSRAMFMWRVTKSPQRSVEAIGTVRLPTAPKAADADATGMLEDVGYILQSLIVR